MQREGDGLGTVSLRRPLQIGRKLFALAIICGVTVADQATKSIATSYIHLHDSIEVYPGVFDLTYIQNTGAAWGIFSGANHWLVTLSIAMLLVLVRYRRQIVGNGWVSRLALGLLLGGILGNLIDRMRLGYVIDFLDFHWDSAHFPAFNVADSAICVGVMLYLLLQFSRPDGQTDTASRPLQD